MVSVGGLLPQTRHGCDATKLSPFYRDGRRGSLMVSALFLNFRRKGIGLEIGL